MSDHDNLNPLIESAPAATLFNVSCAVGFLGRVHAAIAGGAPVGMEDGDVRGVALLLDCIRAAVDYEIDRAPAEVQP